MIEKIAVALLPIQNLTGVVRPPPVPVLTSGAVICEAVAVVRSRGSHSHVS